MTFFYLELVFFFFANCSFKEKAYLLIIDFDNFLDDFIREVMNRHFFIIFPDHDVFFLKINTNKFAFFIEE